MAITDETISFCTKTNSDNWRFVIFGQFLTFFKNSLPTNDNDINIYSKNIWTWTNSCFEVQFARKKHWNFFSPQSFFTSERTFFLGLNKKNIFHRKIVVYVVYKARRRVQECWVSMPHTCVIIGCRNRAIPHHIDAETVAFHR